MKIAIIIPVYNEAKNIKSFINSLENLIFNKKNTEIIIVDGHSPDNTFQELKSFDTAKVLQSEKGRGKQMNFGAKAAQSDILYFLHADSYPPKHFDQLIRQKVEIGKLSGCFRLKFDSKHVWLRLAGWFTQFNLKFFRGGDQSLFITKELFYKIGGYPEEQPIFEDYEVIRKLYVLKQFTVIQEEILTSARRYSENGICRLQYHYWMIYIKKWFGASNATLYKYYKTNVK